VSYLSSFILANSYQLSLSPSQLALQSWLNSGLEYLCYLFVIGLAAVILPFWWSGDLKLFRYLGIFGRLTKSGYLASLRCLVGER